MGFNEALAAWFKDHARDYPWRRTRDPYAILVSELMLQQTQIATVLGKGYYERWMERFPDTASLAVADEAEILKAWEGLGYYRRARHLRAAAQVVEEELGGRFPRTLDGLLALPGVGRYTAGAVASLAFGLRAPVVDGNVARVLARLFDYRQPVDTPGGQKPLWAWADALVPEKEPGAHNSALMELGQRICRKTAPDCRGCPVSGYCATGDPESLPVKRGGPKVEHVVECVAFCREAPESGRVLLEQEEGRRRQGLWKLPELAVGMGSSEDREPVLRLVYSITRYRVELRVYEVSAAEFSATDDEEAHPAAAGRPLRAWYRPQEIEALAMPAPYRKALRSLLDADLE